MHLSTVRVVVLSPSRHCGQIRGPYLYLVLSAVLVGAFRFGEREWGCMISVAVSFLNTVTRLISVSVEGRERERAELNDDDSLEFRLRRFGV